MTTAELHEILDDENRKLTADELKEVVYQLKQDCNDEYHKQIMMDDYEKAQFYSGETNAFHICLDLLEHLKGADNEQVYGRWLCSEIYCTYICSECEECAPVDDFREPRLTDFCPNCGAKMKGGAE